MSEFDFSEPEAPNGLLKVGDNSYTLYHAGEPMTVGITFYQSALRLIDKHKPPAVKLTNVVQTNGVLINEEWAKFFSDHEFRVGVSLDGPEFLHNLNRKNWSGVGSFNKAVEGFKLVKKYNVNTGILSVITSEHLKYPEELIKFYASNNMTDIGFNTEEVENDNKISSLGIINTIKRDEYYAFMNKISDLALIYKDSIKIREISDSLNMLLNLKNNPSYQKEPLETINLGIITIQKNGDISTYCPEFAGTKSQEYNNFVIGNVLNINKISDVKQNPHYIKIKAAYDQRKEKCKKQCKYYAVCGSAFLSSAYSESGSLLTTENIGCILQRQTLTDLMLHKVKSISNKYFFKKRFPKLLR